MPSKKEEAVESAREIADANPDVAVIADPVTPDEPQTIDYTNDADATKDADEASNDTLNAYTNAYTGATTTTSTEGNVTSDITSKGRINAGAEPGTDRPSGGDEDQTRDKNRVELAKDDEVVTDMDIIAMSEERQKALEGGDERRIQGSIPSLRLPSDLNSAAERDYARARAENAVNLAAEDFRDRAYLAFLEAAANEGSVELIVRTPKVETEADTGEPSASGTTEVNDPGASEASDDPLVGGDPENEALV